VKFSRGKVVSDDKRADGGEIGELGATYRRIRIESQFGKMQVMVTDGHLPYPFGHELTGYEVKDLDATLDKAKAANAKVLSPRFDASDRSTAIVEFPGGYVAEIHAPRSN
jgi:predicted enzyme related to lactoylglutathione lyase